jgi:ribonuclease G
VLEAIRPEGVGLIARTAAAKRTQEEIHGDLDRLMRVWADIQKSAARKTAPAAVYSEPDLPLRVIRDQPSEQLEEILIDGKEPYDALGAELEDLDPELRKRLSLSDETGRLFETAGVDTAIQRALRGRVWLPCGGYIVINPTEALIAIDINTGRYTGSEDIETTAFKVNSEAAVEIARQVRLRDLSGIIIVDFIDMEKPEHRKGVLDIFQAELDRDRTRIHLSGMSELGLVEVTRKRSRTDLGRRLTEPCRCCHGRGRVKTPRTVGLDLRRALTRFIAGQPDRPFHVELHPQVTEALEGNLRAILEEIEITVGAAVELRQNAALNPDEFRIVTE